MQLDLESVSMFKNDENMKNEHFANRLVIACHGVPRLDLWLFWEQQMRDRVHLRLALHRESEWQPLCSNPGSH